jgi:hypothetical protein
MESEPLTGNQTIRQGRESEAHLDGGGTEKDDIFPAKRHGVRRVSALYQLQYWRVSPLTKSLKLLLVYFLTHSLRLPWLLHRFVLHTRIKDNIKRGYNLFLHPKAYVCQFSFI